MRKKCVIIPLFISVCITFSGCSGKNKMEHAKVVTENYEKIVYDTVDVAKGDLTPILELKLKSSEYSRITYFPAEDQMEIDKVYVAVGDEVSDGDVLVSFKLGDIEEQITAYRDELTNNQLLIEHYVNIMNIDSTYDYTGDIEAIKQRNSIIEMYIKELNVKIDSYSIKAEGDGVVQSLSQIIELGVADSNDGIVEVLYGSQLYTVETSDDFEFVIGDIYSAKSGVGEYNLELVNIEETGVDSDGNTIRSLSFEACEDSVSIMSKPMVIMTIEKPVEKDVCYIPQKAVHVVDDKSLVYVLDSEGFREVKYVKTGICVDDNIVIEEGLDENDRVVIE